MQGKPASIRIFLELVENNTYVGCRLQSEYTALSILLCFSLERHNRQIAKASSHIL
ncbi:Uncharacterised protein [Corynebacterium amycolatum]|nr:Uncharacterised protein [Corynebacterium amycolatum]